MTDPYPLDHTNCKLVEIRVMPSAASELLKIYLLYPCFGYLLLYNKCQNLVTYNNPLLMSCDFSGSRIWTGFGQVVLLFHGIWTVTLWYSAGMEVWRVKDDFAHILVLWWGWWKDWPQLGLVTGMPMSTHGVHVLSLLHGGLNVIAGLLAHQLRSSSAWPYRTKKSRGVTIIGWNNHQPT